MICGECGSAWLHPVPVHGGAVLGASAKTGPGTMTNHKHGEFSIRTIVKTPGGREIEFDVRHLGPRAGAHVVRLLTELSSKGDLAFCPACELVGGEHHLSCLVPQQGYPCNFRDCTNFVRPEIGVERSGWFYCGPGHADDDTRRRLQSMRTEHTPRDKWCAHDLDAGTYRGPGST